MAIYIDYSMMILLAEIIFGGMTTACLLYMIKRFVMYCCNIEPHATVYLERPYPHRDPPPYLRTVSPNHPFWHREEDRDTSVMSHETDEPVNREPLNIRATEYN